jgi:xanthine dehydrogenase large subunit
VDLRQPERKIRLVELLDEAYLNRVSLGGYGYARYEGIHYNKETGQGQPFFYYTNGVAASEVSIDRFTGEAKVVRTDILMDLGRPINHGVDLGQTTGAFVQGMGWVTTENLFYDPKGRLLSISPSTYKIPSVQDIPRVFNVHLLENLENTKNLLGNKAVGEPPLLLAISVWTAIKNALTYSGKGVIPALRLPATQEEILCSNAFPD